MPDNILPATGAVVALERVGIVAGPAANDVVYLGKFGWGAFGTYNPIVRDGAGGMPVQFDVTTSTVFGLPNEVAAANEGSTAGIIPLLKALLRDLRARLPVLGQAAMTSSIPVAIASNQSPLSITGTAALQVGGSAAAAGPGTAGSTTLRTVIATDQPAVPMSPTILGRTTRELGAVTRQAVVANAATFALPPLGLNREIWISPSTRCFFVTGAGAGMAAAAPGSAYPVPVDAGWVFQVPAGHTHFSVIRDTADGFISAAAAL